jgi:hypothetical protein
MGIKDFAKVFAGKDASFKECKGKTFIVDAMVEIYRAALGMKNVKGLTDKNGNPTLHISVILSNIIKMRQHEITQIWVFDYDANGQCHNLEKKKELEKRRIKREKATHEISTLQLLVKEKEIIEFSDSDSDSDTLPNKPALLKTQDEIKNLIAKQEKRAFRVTSKMIHDVKFLLDGFGIRWTEAPIGYESEQIAAMLTHTIPNSLVLTVDADALLFGARSILKKNVRTKKYIEFTLSTILNDNNLDIDQLIKVGIVLGSDFAPKTRGVGPKTVLKKLSSIVYTPEQEKAHSVFTRTYDVSNLTWNTDKSPFVNHKAGELIDWLVECKSFNKIRITNQIGKVVKLD